jgi:hypothetical protein
MLIDDTTPAIGADRGPSQRERRVRQVVLALAVLAAAFGLFARETFRKPPAERLPTVGNVAWVVDGVLMRGAQPRDIDLANLRDLFNIGGVVSLRRPDPVAKLAAHDFSLAYLSVPVTGRAAPTPAQLAEIAAFIRGQERRGRAVYIHDATGVEQAPTVAAMLLVARGASADDAVAAITDDPDEVARYFRPRQLAAIEALAHRVHLSGRRLAW